MTYAFVDEIIPHSERRRVRFRCWWGTTVGRTISRHASWLTVQLDNGQRITATERELEVCDTAIPPVPARPALRLMHDAGRVGC